VAPLRRQFPGRLEKGTEGLFPGLGIDLAGLTPKAYVSRAGKRSPF